ncbi:NAD(P)-dependent oxidoreductase [Candidatus Parcubacteria bacterium]|nr:MAG: NAD(P)-dependent oxidoreductase [Candidatus Parcubacteria bacterium]
MKINILLTGCTGFLGGHLARFWVQKGHHLTALSSTCRRTPLLEPVYHEIEWVSYEKMNQAFTSRSYDALVHCAGSYGRKGETEADLVDVNVRLGLKLLAEANKRCIGKFINAGSALPKLTSAYALSKAQFAEWMAFLSPRYKGALVYTRLQHMYGPCDDETKFVTGILRKMLKNAPSIALTRGDQERDFIFIDDVVSAFDTLLLHDLGVGFHEFDIGSGEAVSIRSLAEMIKNLCGSRSELRFGAIQARSNEPDCLKADISALAKLGWHCSAALEEGLRKTITAEQARPVEC